MLSALNGAASPSRPRYPAPAAIGDTYTPYVDHRSDGSLAGFYALITDITQRASQSQRLPAAIVQSSSDAIISKTPRRRHRVMERGREQASATPLRRSVAR